MTESQKPIENIHEIDLTKYKYCHPTFLSLVETKFKQNEVKIDKNSIFDAAAHKPEDFLLSVKKI